MNLKQNTKGIANSGGRPSKLSKGLTVALKNVLSKGDYQLFTERQLVIEANELLQEKSRISYDTWKRIKRKLKNKSFDEMTILETEFCTILTSLQFVLKISKGRKNKQGAKLSEN